MNTIETIRAEIERLKEENNNIRCDSNKAYCQGYGDAFVDFLSFLSDLEKSNSKDFPTTDEEMKQFLATHPKVELPEKYKTPDWLFEKSEKPTNPVCEGLEEEISGMYQALFGTDVINRKERLYLDTFEAIARHFYELGRQSKGLGWTEKDKSIINNIIAYEYLNIDDLEWLKELPERFDIQQSKPKVCEGLEEYASRIVAKLVPSFGQKYPDGRYVGGIRDYFSREELIGLVKAGAKWQKEQDTRDMFMSDNRHFEKVYELGKKDMKEQMLKEAIHYVVQDDLDSHGASYNIPFIRIGIAALKPKGIGVGDKVRIIIVKED